MTTRHVYDAVVVGAGPNGLAAAITLAQAGLSVLVLEAQEQVGGGTRSAELTRPGFIHDVCSAIHPLGLASPFLRSLPLEEHGLTWIQPPAPLAHPLDGEPAVIVERDLEATAAGLGPDAGSYTSLLSPFVTGWQHLTADLLAPLHLPKRPLQFARFGLRAIRPAAGLARGAFHGHRARALFAGLAGHAIQPLESPVTSAIGLVLGMLAHAVGWPLARGGSQAIAEALAAYLKSLGGEIQTASPITTHTQLPSTRVILYDVTPRQLLAIAGDHLPAGYRRQLGRFRYGPGVFKIDFALDGPVPWQDPACLRAATVHVGGSLEEIARAERRVWAGEHAEQPFVLVAQPSLFDPSRAPAGHHTLWAYCHVPSGSSCDQSGPIEAQIERFAPGFKDRILDRHTFTATDMESYNPNYVGGDISGGVQDLRQLFTRPVPSLSPYRTPARGIYLCSSSTPPGGGVHGMCGYHAALAALHDLS